MYKQAKGLFTVVLVFCAFLICGCNSGMPKAATTSESYSVVDANGNKVVLPKKPTKVLAQSMTLDTMVLGIVPPEKMVAKCFLDDEPDSSYIVEETKNIKTSIHSFTSIPTETALELKPDIIILPTTAKPEMANTFRDLGFPVLIVKSPRNIEDVKFDIKLIASALKEEEAGNNVIRQMDEGLKEIHETVAKLNKKQPVAMLVSRMTSYGGKGSMYDEICKEARVINGISAVGINNGEKLTKELVVKADPDFFLVSKNSGRKKENTDLKTNAEEFKQEFLTDKALTGMRALNHIYEIPNKYLYSNSQNCIWAIKGMANYAYGPIFDMSKEKLIKGY